MCSLKKILGQNNFPNQSLCLDPSKTKLFNSYLSAGPSSQLFPPPSQPHSIVQSTKQLYPSVFVSLQEVVAKPFVIQGPSLASPISLSCPPLPGLPLGTLHSFWGDSRPVTSNFPVFSEHFVPLASMPFLMLFPLPKMPIPSFLLFCFSVENLFILQSFLPFFYYRVYQSDS